MMGIRHIREREKKGERERFGERETMTAERENGVGHLRRCRGLI
jgi:hypothetical protein